MKMKIGAVVLALGVATVTLTGCGDDAETQKCIDQLTATLKDAGSDRALTQDEKDACSDPSKRAFILSE